MKSTHIARWFIITATMVSTFFLPVFADDAAEKSAQSLIILEEFKKILSVDKEYSITCQMATFAPDQKPVIKRYKLFSKNNKTLMIISQPERDAGKKILMIKDDLWQYFPKIQKTMVINSAMNIGGSVNLTDIISSSLFQFYNFSGYEYDAKSETSILTFTAAAKSSPYGRVRYFYSHGKIDYFEAYARSGILLKKIIFAKYEVNDQGQNYPVQIKIVNALQENDYSLIQMSSFKSLKIPEYYFNPSAMDKIHE